MARRLFSELSPTTYQIALARRRMQRRIADGLRRSSFARQASQESLPVKVYTHNSLIRRRLGNDGIAPGADVRHVGFYRHVSVRVQMHPGTRFF